ncbi:MAG: FtsX-like permease family protein [Bacteroidota bacterium]
MLTHYLKVVYRNFWKNRLYASLNVLGLAIGFAAFGLVLMYVWHENSYDRFHQKADRIVRVTHAFQSNQDFAVHWARVPVDFVNQLPDEIPEIEQLIRFQNQEKRFVRVGENKFQAKDYFTTDSAVFEVFDFPLLAGDPQKALTAPHSVVLTQSAARKYFGTEDVLGKEMMVFGEFFPEEVSYQVTGLMSDLPTNTHMPIEMLFSFESHEARRGWAYVYCQLVKGATKESIAPKVAAFVKEREDANELGKLEFVMQKLPDIHLHSQLAREIQPAGNAMYPRLFLAIGIFILLIAMFNYINLSNALAAGRGKEVGMRKMLGAGSRHIVFSSLLESIAYNVVAVVLGILMIQLALPFFESLVDTHFAVSLLDVLPWLLLIALLCGVLAGLYPAFLLSSFKLLAVIRQRKSFSLRNRRPGLSPRQLMVGLQFGISILLIGSTLVAWDQLRYIQNRNLGLDQSRVVAFSAGPQEIKAGFTEFRQRVSNMAGVAGVSGCMQTPSEAIRDTGPVLVQGKNQDPRQAPMMDGQVIGPDFIELMGIELVAGVDRSGEKSFALPPPYTEDFTPQQYLSERPRSYLINETAMKQLGFNSPEEALGQQINWSIGGYQTAFGPITGIVKDHHQESLRNLIDPTVYFAEPIWLGTLLVKLEAGDVVAAMDRIESVWSEMFPTFPMQYHFLDELFDRLYQQERHQLQLLMILSALSIFIAFLGLFALVAYSLQTREKELAIRKVLGANATDLVRLIGKEYALVLLLGSLVAIPVSVIQVQSWLNDFAYHTEISPIAYGLTIVMVLALLIGTIGLQILRNRRRDPARALKAE